MLFSLSFPAYPAISGNTQTKKEPQNNHSEALCLKGGGYLLSRIALQYHRRKQA